MAPDNKSKFLRDAERFVLQGKIQQAIGEYLKIVKNDPGDVLTLNTVGDLYLRLGKVTDANQYFMEVAENYARNNFLLKAIAVYKKVLSSEPQNIEVNLTVASLYAKQGLNIDARDLYLRVADLYAKEGNNAESIKAYENVVELDPTNIAVQKKLADIHLAEGANEKALGYIVGAAQAQAKAGDLASATQSFERALRINPGNAGALRGLVDCSLKTGNTAAALHYLKESLQQTPQNAELLEMSGRLYLEAGDAERAVPALKEALRLDESRYQQFFALSKFYIEARDNNRAAECLDPIVPILIARRETGRAIEAYDVVLERDPSHVLTLTRLAAIYSAANNQEAYLSTLERVSEYYLSTQNPTTALEYLEKILQVNPTSEKHMQLHRQAFEQAFPGEPYREPPNEVKERSAPSLAASTRSEDRAVEESSPKIVEADLLLNYGMRDRALQLLLELETEDPSNEEVRRRLLSIYKEDKRAPDAAEQCLLLAALCRKDNKESEARKYLAEAASLDPDLDKEQLDLSEFARNHGIAGEAPSGLISDGLADSKDNIEIDLSEDLSEIFFKAEKATADEEPGVAADRDTISEEYPGETTERASEESLNEQMQEVDFYLRLGFHEEARIKLDQIARFHPDCPGLASRYQQINDGSSRSFEVSESPATDADKVIEILPAGNLGEVDVFSEMGIEPSGQEPEARQQPRKPPAEPGQPVELSSGGGGSIKSSGPIPNEHPIAQGTFKSDRGINEMFADLMDEVNSMTEYEIAKEEFESHFSLGLAYRESDLLEDAIKEFQSAVKPLDPVKSPREIIQCCGMLSTCFLDRGMPRSAIRWCQTGLNVPGISPHETIALQYDMGVAYTLAGNSEDALKCLGYVFGIDPSFRDVAQKIDDLKGGSTRNVL